MIVMLSEDEKDVESQGTESVEDSVSAGLEGQDLEIGFMDSFRPPSKSRGIKSTHNAIQTWYNNSLTLRLAKLTISQRQLVLTDCCPELTTLLIDMASRSKEGDGVAYFAYAEPAETRALCSGDLSMYTRSYTADPYSYLA